MLPRTKHLALLVLLAVTAVAALVPATSALAANRGIRATIHNETDQKLYYNSVATKGGMSPRYSGHEVLDPGETKWVEHNTFPNLDVILSQCGSTRTEIALENPWIGAPTAALKPQGSPGRTGFDEGESQIFQQPGIEVRITRRADANLFKEFDLFVLRCTKA